MKKEKAGLFDAARCLHSRNMHGMTIGRYLSLNVGEEIGSSNCRGGRIFRVSWTTWSVNGNLGGLFESYGGAK